MIRPSKAPRRSTKGETLWIVDLDYTLLDLYRFMDEFGLFLNRTYGISESLYKNSKNDVQDRMLYSFERHLRAIQKESKLSHADAMRYVGTLLKRSRRYFFPDALPFMRRIAKQGEVVLLTQGHTLQQQRKIEASGIEQYCDRVIITSSKAKKAEWVKKLAKGRERVMIVNDDPEEAHGMAAALASTRAKTDMGLSRVVLVERRAGKYFPIAPHKDYVVVKDLREIVC